MPGSQFPAEAYDNFVKQGVPRWTTNDDATIAAYLAEIDRVGPCIIMVHSQAGSFGFKVAQARPDKVKALIVVEAGRRRRSRPCRCAEEHSNPDHLMAITSSATSAGPKMRATGIAFADGIKAAGGSVDVVDLPQAGIKGNSHMIMMDKNNAEVAGLIQKWLEGKGLTR